DRVTGLAAAGIGVNFYDSSNNFVGAGFTGQDGRYVAVGLPTGQYYARTWNRRGYINRLYPDIACGPCSVTSGTAINVLAGVETGNVNFSIAPGGAQIRGLVAQAGTSSGIGAVNVTVYDDQNRFVVFGFTNADGTYSTEGGL